MVQGRVHRIKHVTHQSTQSKDKKTTAAPYLVPGRDGAPEAHEQVRHGDQAQPDDHGEEAEQLPEHGLDAHEDEDREEDGQGGGDRD